MVATAEKPPEVKRLPLPVAREASLTFYAVKPKGLKGWIPAFCTEDNSMPLVKNPENPYVRLNMRYIENERQASLMENPRLEFLEEKGEVVQVTCRVWRNANPNYKHRRYVEDARVAPVVRNAPVVAVTLWCPLRWKGPTGALEEHGPYAGVTPDDPESGVCPKCAGADAKDRPLVFAKARKAIYEHFATCNIPAPQALAERVVLENVR